MQIFMPLTDEMLACADAPGRLVPYQPGVALASDLRAVAGTHQPRSRAPLSPAAIPARPRAERPAALPPRR